MFVKVPNGDNIFCANKLVEVQAASTSTQGGLVDQDLDQADQEDNVQQL